MIQTNLKLLFTEAGIEEIRPTEQALEKMGISRRRYTQLVENINKTPITVPELAAIQSWIATWSEIDLEKIVALKDEVVSNT
jgi:hypothetical protein